MKYLLATTLLVGCGLSEERYWDLREEQDCRIFGPDCTGDYDSLGECIGDESEDNSDLAFGSYHPQLARDCILALKKLCPSRALDFNVPVVCDEVYASGE